MSAASRLSAPLCIVSLTYVADVAEVDRAMADHVAWLEQGFAEGVFLACGRKVPRTGGVILVRGHEAEVAALAATDPFVERGLATAQVTAFTASMAAPPLAGLIG